MRSIHRRRVPARLLVTLLVSTPVVVGAAAGGEPAGDRHAAGGEEQVAQKDTSRKAALLDIAEDRVRGPLGHGFVARVRKRVIKATAPIL